MKSVLHIITTISRGGAENQLLILVEEQLRQGFDVSVVYLKGEPELLGDFELLGAKVFQDAAKKGLLRQPWIIRNIAKKSGAVIHAHLPRAELMTLFLPFSLTIVASRHNAEPFFPGAPKFLSNFLAKTVSLRAKHIIAISQAVRKFLLNQGEVFDKDKIEVVLYGYYCKRTVTERIKKFNLNLQKIGSVSRLSEQKDIPTMIKIFEKVKEEAPNAILEIVGAGPLESSLKSLTKKAKLETDINFLGKTDKIIEFIESLDVFILTSKYEGFGLALLEAIDAGVPIVASRNSAIPEVLGDDFPGLCQTGDVEDFFEKILLLRNLDYRLKVLEMQEKRILLFSAEMMANKIEQCYFE